MSTYLTLKYKYKYKYSGHKYKYKYKYFKMVLEYYSSTSTSTKYYISGIHWDEFLGQECGFSDVSIICKHLWNLQNGALEICRGCISVKVNWWHYWMETRVDQVDLCSGLCSPGQVDLRASLLVLWMRVTWSPASAFSQLMLRGSELMLAQGTGSLVCHCARIKHSGVIMQQT